MNEEREQIRSWVEEIKWNGPHTQEAIGGAIMYLLACRECELDAQEKAPDLSDRG